MSSVHDELTLQTATCAGRGRKTNSNIHSIFAHIDILYRATCIFRAEMVDLSYLFIGDEL